MELREWEFWLGTRGQGATEGRRYGGESDNSKLALMSFTILGTVWSVLLILPDLHELLGH